MVQSLFSRAVVSDGQSVWALPEMRATGIDQYFDTVIISSDFGFRKPDQRLFQAALDGIGVGPEEVLFVGNDMYRDVFGAKRMGMKTVFFASNQGRRQMEGTQPDYMRIVSKPRNLTIGSKSRSQWSNANWWWMQKVAIITSIVLLTVTPFFLKCL